MTCQPETLPLARAATRAHAEATKVVIGSLRTSWRSECEPVSEFLLYLLKSVQRARGGQGGTLFFATFHTASAFCDGGQLGFSQRVESTWPHLTQLDLRDLT